MILLIILSIQLHNQLPNSTHQINFLARPVLIHIFNSPKTFYPQLNSLTQLFKPTFLQAGPYPNIHISKNILNLFDKYSHLFIMPRTSVPFPRRDISSNPIKTPSPRICQSIVGELETTVWLWRMVHPSLGVDYFWPAGIENRPLICPVTPSVVVRKLYYDALGVVLLLANKGRDGRVQRWTQQPDLPKNDCLNLLSLKYPWMKWFKNCWFARIVLAHVIDDQERIDRDRISSLRHITEFHTDAVVQQQQMDALARWNPDFSAPVYGIQVPVPIFNGPAPRAQGEPSKYSTPPLFFLTLYQCRNINTNVDK